MAVKSSASAHAKRSRRKDDGASSLIPKLLKNPKTAMALALLFIDSLLISFIIAYVPYTKIDWDAYMSQVSGFLGGERDYKNLKGDTGPLVYPAGFLYVYSAIRYITGGQVFPAQLPWWALSLICLSKRVHSIFVLRLFNDCFAMTLLHAAVASILHQRWHLGLIIFSAAVSIKMNVLLYAPPLFILMLKAMNISGVISALAGAALVQIVLGLPFLVSYPTAYISCAFNLGRVFIHFWSVNFKFIPEPIFVSKEFAVSLLIAHLLLLSVFAHYKWCKHEGGLFNFFCSRIRTCLSTSMSSWPKILKKEHIATTMFAGNFIGIVCARSLHYQFYSWYFYSLPYLLWRTPFPTLLRVLLFVGVELCWNVYPSNFYSSALLLCLHLFILWGLWSSTPENPYASDKSLSRKEN
ncbi:dol-P-Man:Man(5)GlcNAc(2)-PP-Dol alpha-1,3-mannosyltransferase isoform X2 [Durio zibethinus]|uniref:dolichyl-P-Man:Man5GlcNAc2-PP-dolichol alpha-1,3-mannosyltransferase n=1 Tax=Durio zibethinus TaxID=66656 RepID=A0A6P6B196_DURZI|nr:dol-P-Man:Man(5)GlcNAc(2)-PP-Dol alpha-1,3-mannosyltransferase isoform X2 [Durio zibethinus]